MIVLKNYAGSSLAVALGAAESVAQVLTADAAKFPVLDHGDVFPARIRDAAGGHEYVLATARSGNQITILRGQEGTTARAFAAGASFELVVTAKAWDMLAENRWVRAKNAAGDALTPTRVSATQFSLPGDVAALFAPNRAVRLIQSATACGYVSGCAFSGGVTTVTVQAGLTVDAGLSMVELGLEVQAAPKYGNASNADTLGGSTKAQVVAEALGGTSANSAKLEGKSRAEIVGEARSGLMSASAVLADSSARSMAMRNTMRLGLLTGEASGSIPGGFMYLFASDELEIKAGATHGASLYVNAGTISGTKTALSASCLSATGFASFSASAMINGATAASEGGYVPSGTAVGGAILKVDYGAGVARRVGKIRVYGHAATSNGQYYIQYSDDGAAWLNTNAGVLDIPNGSWAEWTIPYSVGARRGWHIINAATPGSQAWWSELEVYEYGPATDMVLVPAAVTVGSVPSIVDVYLLHKAMDSVTLNTDLKVRVSRDGGLTWSGYVTLSEVCQVGDYRLLKCTADLSALASGTSLKWETTTYNAKSQQLRAVAFQIVA